MKNKMKKVIAVGSMSALCVTAFASVAFEDVSVEGHYSSTNTLVEGGSLAVGASNTATNRSTSIGQANLTDLVSVAGGIQNLAGRGSATFGVLNTVNYIPSVDGTSNSSPNVIGFAFGRSNEVHANSAAAIGQNNLVNADGSLAAGENLLNSNKGSTVVGKFNEDMDGAVFTVGIGDSSSRQNALVVKDDGSIIINQVQGDISMGVFGTN